MPPKVLVYKKGHELNAGHPEGRSLGMVVPAAMHGSSAGLNVLAGKRHFRPAREPLSVQGESRGVSENGGVADLSLAW